MNTVTAQPDINEFVISRTVNAPRDLVWEVWTDPQHLQHWFGPKGVTVGHSEMNLHPGGIYHYSMKTPDGNEMWGKWTFQEIQKPERIVATTSFSDPEGGLTRHPLSDKWPLEMLTKMLFKDEGDKTDVTIRWSPVNAKPEEIAFFNQSHSSMNEGWGGTFERLDTYLAELVGQQV